MTKVLKLALLGPVHMSWDDEPVADLVSSKAQALLCYLACNGRAHARPALATLLWTDLPEADARRNLRGVVMKLRQAIGDYLLVTAQTVGINPHLPLWLDVAEFQKMLAVGGGRGPAAAELAAALALYRGDFLADVYVRQAPAFEEWVMQERTNLREKALAAYMRATTHHAAAGTYAAGISLAREALAFDPLREELHMQLMRLLALNGQRSAALTQYEQCRYLQATELKMTPSAEMEALAGQIRAGTVGSGTTAVSPIPSPLPSTRAPAASFVVGPPVQHPRHFFGRERILKRLFGLIRQRPLQNAAIIGPRRSGKTSLLHYLRAIHSTPAAELRPGQKQDWLPQPHLYRWVFVDFQDPRLGSRANLMAHLLKEMGLTIPTMLDLDTFLDVVAAELVQPTIILLDEIGVALARYPELDNAFWESLRSLASHQVRGNLGFVLSAAQPPDELAQHSGLGSPFFNIFGYTAVMPPLSDEEAQTLIAYSPVPIPAAEAAWMMAESGRWPILLQLLCREYVLAQEEGVSGDGWREEARRQLDIFRHALPNE